MVKLNKRTTTLWIVTAFVAGSLGASLSDMVRQNSWFIVYAGLICAWLFVLTGIATVHLDEKKPEKP